MKYITIILLAVSFPIFSFSQNEKLLQQDSSWLNLKTTAHQIGFCIYHSSQNHCVEHANEFAKRKKTSPEDIEVHYFEMKKEWAESRLNKWAERQGQPVDNFMIFFDVAQKSSLERTDHETVSSYFGFVIIDLTDSIYFNLQKIENNKSKITIASDDENAMMENFLWREFMTRRLGRYSGQIDFKLIGKNTESDFENFKKAFLKYQNVF